MKKLLVITFLLILAWAVLCNDWTLSWNGHLCTYQAHSLSCSQMHAPEYKFGRPKKFDYKTPQEQTYQDRYTNFFSDPL
jgi:hypothetical protein